MGVACGVAQQVAQRAVDQPRWQRVASAELALDLAQCDLDRTSGLRTAIDMVRAQGLPVPIVEFTVDDVVRSGACAMWVRAFAEHEAVRMAAE